MTIGARLKQVLEVEGQTIKGLADESGIPYRTLQQYLSDARKPGSEHLAKLAQAGVDLHWLLLGETDAALTIKVSEESKLDGPLAIDSTLSQYFLEDALNMIDEWHTEYVTERGHPLSAAGIVRSIYSIMRLYDGLLKHVWDQVFQARRAGFEPEQIARMILSPPIRETIRHRLKLISHNDGLTVSTKDVDQ